MGVKKKYTEEQVVRMGFESFLEDFEKEYQEIKEENPGPPPEKKKREFETFRKEFVKKKKNYKVIKLAILFVAIACVIAAIIATVVIASRDREGPYIFITSEDGKQTITMNNDPLPEAFESGRLIN